MVVDWCDKIIYMVNSGYGLVWYKYLPGKLWLWIGVNINIYMVNYGYGLV